MEDIPSVCSLICKGRCDNNFVQYLDMLPQGASSSRMIGYATAHLASKTVKVQKTILHRSPIRTALSLPLNLNLWELLHHQM